MVTSAEPLSSGTDSVSDASVLDLLTQKGLLAMTSDSNEMSELCESIIAALPKEAEAVRAGNQKVISKMIGEAMRRTKGRADARLVSDTLSSLLSRK